MDQAAALKVCTVKLDTDFLADWSSGVLPREGGIVNVVRVDELWDWSSGLGGFRASISADKTGRQVQPAALKFEGVGGDDELVCDWLNGSG